MGDKNIYNLGLHQTLEFNSTSQEDEIHSETWKVTRVPGGFIYYNYTYKMQTFVPYNDEFKEQPYRNNIF